jgi:hypothetical protein
METGSRQLRMQGEPEPARHLVDLPRDNRGYPVPAEAPWVDGVPQLADMDWPVVLIMAAHRACPVCGYLVPADEPSWRIFDQESRDDMATTLRARGVVLWNQPPGHLSCMLYSALVCPFWRTEGARMGPLTRRTGMTRGSIATVVGFYRFGILARTATAPLTDGRNVAFVAAGYFGAHDFTRPTELLDLYDRELAQVGDRYLGSQRHHYALPGVTRNRKRVAYDEAAQGLMALTPTGRTNLLGGVEKPFYETGWMVDGRSASAQGGQA